MKLKLTTLLTIFLLTLPLIAQQKLNSWDKINFLIGNWKGEGIGKPGEGEGYFTFKLDLDNNIVVRSSHSEYPAMNNNPAIVHNDLMIIYRDLEGNPNKAIYFDNENHVINYSITYPNNTEVVFISDKIPNLPIFRLTYSAIDDSTVNIKFEISQDGEKYFTYIEGKAKKEK